MLPLVIVSLLWAFSFGLIRRYLVGLDSSAVALLRLMLSLLVFLPWLRFRAVSVKLRLELMAIGAVQFGLMYLLYLEAFQNLAAYQIALLTLLTPIFVCLFDSVLSKRFTIHYAFAALLSIAGALVVMASRPLGRAEWRGILLVQASNACFALGQLLYCRVRRRAPPIGDARLFVWLYLGAVLLVLPYAASKLPHAVQMMSLSQLLVVVYLGVIASGFGFFMWNVGASRVKTGTLAVMNNAKIPLGVFISLVLFGEKTHLPRLGLGALLIVLGLALAERVPRLSAGSST
jgi:drug/metabolite transporter (DMT)-like permease